MQCSLKLAALHVYHHLVSNTEHDLCAGVNAFVYIWAPACYLPHRAYVFTAVFAHVSVCRHHHVVFDTVHTRCAAVHSSVYVKVLCVYL